MLGMLELPQSAAPYEPLKQSFLRVGDYLIDTSSVTDAQLCKLYVAELPLPSALQERLNKRLVGHRIPAHKINLRSAWIPKDLIAQYLDIRLNQEGLFCGDDNQKPLIRFLNYGKASGKIQNYDQEIFQVASHTFAVAMNDFEEEEHKDLRFKIHAYYILAHTAINQVVDALQLVKTPQPLHSWQTEDIPFYLSGAAIF